MKPSLLSLASFAADTRLLDQLMTEVTVEN